ncbi:MAG: UDP-N-acetylglucosamine 1-carboxyvinyltransferase [Verrucomicrobia bacterium]|nr:UDP-N-acetylglucosamine 1-carboxyvinyltransferase [Verrucomicrobiota bacterium]
MSRFIVNGGHPLSGEIRPLGNKNAVLPMLAASVLTDETLTFRNVPAIEDVHVMLSLLEGLGVDVKQRGHTVTLCAKGLSKTELDPVLCRKVRSSILLAGPLAARHGKAVVHPPGGDIIGRRRLDTHFDGLRALGINVRAGRSYTFARGELRGADILFDEASVTATENILMAAVLARGRTQLYNVACEPHVQDLGNLLIKMGARIEGLGTNRLTVHGVRRLRGATHTVQPDHIEIGSFIAAAAATGGSLTIGPVCDELSMRVVARTWKKLGVSWRASGSSLTTGTKALRVKADYGPATPKIEDGPWPLFPSDLMSMAIVLATQAEGTTLFFEKMFESRMYFVDQLISMGAQIVQCDPHRVLVSGPSRLHGAPIASPDIRAGMALVLAALCAKGRSVIENAQVIDRGYERLDERLRSVGADIIRTS